MNDMITVYKETDGFVDESMKYELCKNVMINDTKRLAFDDLIHHTFSLSFETWYQNGFWGEWNQPYTLFDGRKAIANITVNHMHALYKEKEFSYIQLGGVATDPDYRKMGLSRLLMEEVQKDWKNNCDAMLLMANRSVTEFYPRFGFVEELQYQYFWKKDHQMQSQNAKGNIRELNLSQKSDTDILFRCYNKHNPYSELQFIDSIGLFLFNYHYEMKASLYYIEDEDAVLVMKKQGNKLYCYDIYYNGDKSMLQLISTLLNDQINEIEFLFTPMEKQGLVNKIFSYEDTHLFVLKDKDNIFANEKLYLPDVSHT